MIASMVSLCGYRLQGRGVEIPAILQLLPLTVGCLGVGALFFVLLQAGRPKNEKRPID